MGEGGRGGREGGERREGVGREWGGGGGAQEKAETRRGVEEGVTGGGLEGRGGRGPKNETSKIAPVDQKMTNSTPMLCNSSYDCTAPCWDD